MKKILFYWLPLLAYAGLIFTLSSLSSIPFQPSWGLPDKLVHIIEYGLLAALAARALHSLRPEGSRWLTLLFTLLLVAALGSLDEWYQSTVPKRTMELLDWLADLGGGLFGGSLYLLIHRRFRKQS